jgi:hypothetical protein
VCFRQGKALQIVAEVQRALQACLQILRHALAGQCRHVRAELAAAAAVAHAGQGDADGRIAAAERGIGLGDQRHHRLQEAVVVALRGATRRRQVTCIAASHATSSILVPPMSMP